MNSSILPESLRLLSPTVITLALGTFLSIGALLYRIVYNIYFHPLSHIPGPLWNRATPIPLILHVRNGNTVPWIQKLHEKYGDVVRVSPTECSFISGETAWQDMYGFRTGKNKSDSYQKNTLWYAMPANGVRSMISATDEDHTRMRKNLSHAFSDRALRDQEPLVQSYVDLLVQRLYETVESNEPADIMSWYNYTTFDVITDLTFGEPLYCLRDRGYHPWVDLIMGGLKANAMYSVHRQYPLTAYMDKIMGLFTDNTAAMRAKIAFAKQTNEQVMQRLEKDTDRPDFFTPVIKNQGVGGKALTKEEMVSNAQLLMTAGSETTATLLSGATYLILQDPAIYSKLTSEIRERFTSAEEITFAAVEKLEYTIAVLQETLRYYPPVPTAFPRVTPRGGGQVSGHYVPEGTSVYMSQHAANHSTRNFVEPDSFVPERWLKDAPSKFKDDNHAVMNPFSFGPRNCLGKNLAYAEMRVIFAKLLWHFDFELQPGMDDWLERHKLFLLWEKPALMVKLKPVVR